MAFTSWTELRQQMLDDMASGNWSKVSSYSLSTAGGSRNITYRSFAEFKDMLDYVTQQAAQEAGSSSYYGRTRAGQSERGGR